MKLHPSLSRFPLVLALGLSLPLVAAAQHDHHAKPAPKAASASDAQLVAKARANYPLKTCLVSDEPLGSMGEAVPHIHRQSGKPDRVIFVCCEGCIDDFKAEPAKYLRKLDQPQAAKSAAAKAGPPPSARISEQEKAAYPLQVCAVAGEPLGSMGEPYNYIHQEPGKPDRLVRMCCKGCVKDFQKAPAKYLARIDAAAKKAGKSSGGE